MNEITKVQNEIDKIAKEYADLYLQYLSVYEAMAGVNDQDLNDIYKAYSTLKNTDFPCVYFMRNKYTGFVKIGSSKDPFDRMNTLSSMCKNHLGMENALILEGIIYVPSHRHVQYEKQIHKELQQHRKYGEWFDFSYEDILIQYIPEPIFYDKVAVSYMCEDIKNDGFIPLHVDKCSDIKSLQNFIINDTYESLGFEKSGLDKYFLSKFFININNKDDGSICEGTKHPNNRIFWPFVKTNNPPILIELAMWCMKEDVKLNSDNYFFDDKLGFIKNKVFSVGSKSSTKEYSYSTAIIEKIDNYFH